MNILEGLQNEMDRVREVIKVYDEIPQNAGKFAAFFMRKAIEEGKTAINEGDTVKMIATFEKLKEMEC